MATLDLTQWCHTLVFRKRALQLVAFFAGKDLQLVSELTFEYGYLKEGAKQKEGLEQEREREHADLGFRAAVRLVSETGGGREGDRCVCVCVCMRESVGE